MRSARMLCGFMTIKGGSTWSDRPHSSIEVTTRKASSGPERTSNSRGAAVDNFQGIKDISDLSKLGLDRVTDRWKDTKRGNISDPLEYEIAISKGYMMFKSSVSKSQISGPGSTAVSKRVAKVCYCSALDPLEQAIRSSKTAVNISDQSGNNQMAKSASLGYCSDFNIPSGRSSCCQPDLFHHELFIPTFGAFSYSPTSHPPTSSPLPFSLMEDMNITSQESVNQAVNIGDIPFENQSSGNVSVNQPIPEIPAQPIPSPIIIDSTSTNEILLNNNNNNPANTPPTPILNTNSSTNNLSLSNGQHDTHQNFPPIYHPAPMYDQYPDDVQHLVVHFLTREVEPYVRYWQLALVGHFVGEFPEEGVLQSSLETL